MTVTTTTSRVEYTGNGSTTVFSYPFKITADASLKVYLVTTATGVSVLKTLTTHYSVSGAGTASGGNVTMGTEPTSAETLVIEREEPYTNTTDYVENDSFPAETHESALDKLTMLTQQNDRDITRSMRQSTGTPDSVSTELPFPEASKLIAWNADADELENTDKAVSSASVSASDVATSSGAAGTATASVTLSGAGALAFSLGIPIGQTGMMGGVSMQYSTTTADADPGAGFIRLNNTSLNSATILYVDDSDGTTDITAWVQSWDDSNSPNRGFITLAGNPNTSSPLAIFKCNGVITDASGYSKIPVAYVAGSTSISNNAEISMSFSPSGDGDYAGLDYIFSTTTTDSDPGAGTVRLNHGTFSSVTSIFADDADANTANVEDYLLSWDDSTNLSNRGLIRITKKTAPANYALYKISGASTDASGYVKFAVTHLDSNGSISNADTVAIEFSATGNIGIPTGLNFTYSTTTTDSDPGSGVIRFNNATLSSASLAYVDDADSAGANIEALVLSWDDSTNTALRGTITLVKRDNPAIFAIWNITGASVDGSGYSKLSLTYVTGTGSFANNDPVVLSFVRTGNAGVDASYVFKTISVSGQDDVVGDSATDTLTLANGAGIAFTTTAGTDTITIAATGPTLANGVDNRVVTASSSSALNGEANLTFDGNVLAIPDGAVATPSLTNTGDLNTGVYFPAADTVGVTVGGAEKFRFGSNPIPGASKNLIHNGAMTVNQHGSTEVGGSSSIFNLDRFRSTWYALSSIAVSTVTKDSDSPTGFGSSMKFDVTTADSSFEGAYYLVRQDIEGQHCQHLNYGTADALTQTFSFWFKTTITGIYSAWLATRPTGLTYIREFTVQSSNTWEFFQVTFPGYTGAVIADSTAAGLQLGITFGSNALTGAVDQWQAGNDVGGSANQVNGVSSTSNNILTTGWLLEVGEIATSFPHETYSTTLAKCLRYYERITGDVSSQIVGVGVCRSTTNCSQIPFNFAEKRAIPTISINSTSAYDVISSSAGGVATTNLTAQQISTRSTALAATVASGLTDGRPGALDMDADEFIEISAEL